MSTTQKQRLVQHLTSSTLRSSQNQPLRPQTRVLRRTRRTRTAKLFTRNCKTFRITMGRPATDMQRKQSDDRGVVGQKVGEAVINCNFPTEFLKIVAKFRQEKLWVPKILFLDKKFSKRKGFSTILLQQKFLAGQLLFCSPSRPLSGDNVQSVWAKTPGCLVELWAHRRGTTCRTKWRLLSRCPASASSPPQKKLY